MNFTTQQAFAIKVCMGLAVGFWFILWTACQQQPIRLKNWLDVYLGTVLGGIVGARLVFVFIHLDPFLEVPLNIPRLWFGELAWQGAVLGAGFAMWGMCRWRKIELAHFMQGMALAVPLVFIAVCWAARSAGLILGKTVTSLEQHPVWMAAFLPDLNRDVQPRYELQMLGIGLGTAILLIAGGLTLLRWLAEERFWIVMALLALAILLLDYFSAGSGALVFGMAVDEVSAGILWIVSLGMIVLQVSVKRMASSAAE